MEHLVKFGQGAHTLYHVPMDEFGKPQRIASATYSIVDLREPDSSSARVVVASTAATLDAASTTLDETAGPTASHGDPNRLPVAAVTGFVSGRTYLLEKADGSARETVIVSGVDAANGRLYSLFPIQHDYASSDLIRGVEFSGTFPSDDASDEESLQDGGGPYQVQWVYTMNGQVWCVPESIWLSRYDFAPLCTDVDVLMECPMLAERGRGRFTVRMALGAAMDQLVAELMSADMDPSQFRLSPSIRQAVKKKACEYMFRWCQTPADDLRAELYRAEYERLINNLLTGRPGKHVVQVSKADDTAEPSAQVDAFMVPG
jgi:hypothetical protein